MSTTRLLAAIQRFVSATPAAGIDPSSTIAFVPDRDLGLALESSLRQQLNAWVCQCSSAELGRHLAASQALLDEVRRREAASNAVFGVMFHVKHGTKSCVLLARAAATVAFGCRAMSDWLATRDASSPKLAGRLASQLQEIALDLREVAGEADTSDPRQTDWMQLVAEPHTAQLDLDDHASALIGAACWHTAGHGRLRAWQLLAWRLWGMTEAELTDALHQKRSWWPWARQTPQLRDVAKTLMQVRVVMPGGSGRWQLRPRAAAAAGCLAILQARRLDAEEAAKQAMLLPDVRHISAGASPCPQ